MKAIEQTPDEPVIFAAAANQLLYQDPEQGPIRPEQLFHECRYGDQGKDLWITFNVI
jgi:hypothetical protein